MQVGLTTYGDYSVKIGAMFGSHGLLIQDDYVGGTTALRALEIKRGPTGSQTTVFRVDFNGVIPFLRDNLVIGAGAAYPSGNFNFVVGTNAGYSIDASRNTNLSSNNVIFGDRCFGGGGASSTTIMNNNFLFGSYSAGLPTGTLTSNCFIGNQSLSSFKYGSYNIGIGHFQMNSFVGGTYNINFGANTTFPATCNYSIAIGRGATVDKSNQLVLGSTTYKIGRSSAGESGVSSTSPSGISHLLEAKINGSYYQIPLLPSGATNLAATVVSPPISGTTSNFTLSDSHNGYIVEYSGTPSTGVATLGSISLPGWNCMLVNIGSGIAVASGSNDMYSPGMLSGTRTQYSSISIYRRGNGSFLLGGDLA